MALKLPRLDQIRKIVDVATGRATTDFVVLWQLFANSIELAINGIQSALQAAGIAQAAAESAQTSADNAQAAADAAAAGSGYNASEMSIVNSFPTGYSPPLLTADDSGIVTIVSHQRQYGDPTLNPTVPVNGGAVATTAVAGEVVRIFYDDPARAGGAVTYQYTIDPAPFPVQGGDRHSVGAVVIPVTGTQNGGGVRPPGYADAPLP